MIEVKNKDKVFVRFKGLYTDDDSMETVNEGSYCVINGKEYIRYEEEAGNEGTAKDGSAKVTSTIKIDGAGVEVLKKGAINTNMRFVKGEETAFLYSTPYGNMDMSIRTSALDINRDDDRIKICLIYSILMNGDTVSDCELEIEIWSFRNGGIYEKTV